MKKGIICAILVIVSATSFSQQTNPSQPLTRDEYLIKSKTQKTIAWILAGSGAGLVVVAFATFSEKDYANTLFLQDNNTLNTSTTLFVIGGIIALSSIPLFIIAGSNKKKGMSLSFKNETVPLLQKSGFVNQLVPSLTLKLSL